MCPFHWHINIIFSKGQLPIKPMSHLPCDSFLVSHLGEANEKFFFHHLLSKRWPSPLTHQELRAMESLKSWWQQLNFSIEEDNEVVIEKKGLMKGINKGKNCIVGELYSYRTKRKEIIRNTMSKVWKSTKPFWCKTLALIRSYSLLKNSQICRKSCMADHGCSIYRYFF